MFDDPTTPPDPTKPLSVWDATAQAEKDFGIPTGLLRGLGQEESSGLNQYDENGNLIKSNSGATGAFQFTKATARDYNVNRDNPMENIIGAAKYLTDNYKALRPHLDDDADAWMAAAIAHNRGLGAVQSGMIQNRKFVPGGNDSGNGGDTAKYATRIANNWAKLRDGKPFSPAETQTPEAVPAPTQQPAQIGTPLPDRYVDASDIAAGLEAPPPVVPMPTAPAPTLASVPPPAAPVLPVNGQRQFQMPGQPLAADTTVPTPQVAARPAQPVVLTDDQGQSFGQVEDQTGLQPNEVRLMPVGRENKSGQMIIATKTVGPDGKESYQMRPEGSAQPDNASYQDFLKQTGLPDSPDAVNEYKVAQKASVAGANQQNQIDTTAYNAQIKKQNDALRASIDLNRVQEVPPEWKASDQPIDAETVARLKQQNGLTDEQAADLATKRVPRLITDDELMTRPVSFQINLDGVTGDKTAYASRAVSEMIGRKYGLTPEQVDEIAARGFVEGNVKPDATGVVIDTPRSVIAKYTGVDKLRAEYDQQRAEPTMQSVQQATEAEDKRRAENPNEGDVAKSGFYQDEATKNVLGSVFSSGDNAAIQAERERLAKYGLSDADKAEADQVGKNWAELGAGGGAGSGLTAAAGRTLESLAGVLRLSSNLPADLTQFIPEDWINTLSKEGQKFERASQTEAENNRGNIATALRIGTGLAGDAVRYVTLSELPGGAPVLFGTDAGLQSVGRGDRAADVVSHVAKNVAIGSMFTIGSKVADAIENNTLRGFVNPAFDDAALQATPLQRLAAKLFGEGVKIGTVGAGTATVARVTGSSPEESFYTGVTMALTGAILDHGAEIADGIKGLAGKIFRATKGDETVNVTVTPTGDVKLLKGAVPDDLVDVDMVLDPTDGVYKAASELPQKNLNEAPAKRIEKPMPDALQRIAVDSRANKIADILKDGEVKTLDEITKASRYNRGKVNETIELLYAAGKIEITPDNGIRLIEPIESTPLYEQYDQSGRVKASETPQNGTVSTTSPQSGTKSAETPANTEQSGVDDGLTDKAAEWQPSGKTTEIVKPVYEAPPTTTAEMARQEGKYTRDGVEYTRQEPLAEAEPTGNEGKVRFADAEPDPAFNYRLMEASMLQPADLGGNPNRNHFLPEAQPKDRSTAASKIASDEIAKNPDLGQVAESPNAYSGAPVVNDRGEVIQGNNRAEGLKKHYSLGGTSYKEDLKKQADRFGFTPEQVKKLKNPVLVRQVKADDATAIRLGQYTFHDLESGGSQRVNPITTAARIPHEEKSRMLDDIFRNAPEDSTLKEIIRDNRSLIQQHLDPHLTNTQKETLVNANKEFTPDAVKDIEGVFKHFLFTGGDETLPDLFEGLSHHTKEGIIASLPKIFSTKQADSLVPEIQNAIILANRFKDSGAESFDTWLREPHLLDNLPAPVEVYTPAEIELGKRFLNAKTQKDVKDIFSEYAKVVNGHPGDLFEEAQAPQSKAAAVKQVLGVEHAQRTTPTTGKDSGATSARGGETPVREEGQNSPASATAQSAADSGQPAGETTAETGVSKRDVTEPQRTARDLSPIETSAIRRDIAPKEHQGKGKLPSEVARSYGLPQSELDKLPPLGEVGQYGQTSHIIKAALANEENDPTYNDFAKVFAPTEQRDLAPEFPELVDRGGQAANIVDAIAQDMDYPRSSQMDPNAWGRFLDKHALALSPDAINTILSALDHQEKWHRNIIRFVTDPELEPLKKRVYELGDIAGIEGFLNPRWGAITPPEYDETKLGYDFKNDKILKKEALRIGRKYGIEESRGEGGLSDTVIKQTFLRAIQQVAHEALDERTGKGSQRSANPSDQTQGSTSQVGQGSRRPEELDDIQFAQNDALAPAPLLAPNGKPSKLSPYLHKLVRTPEFKEWFGDWEKDPENASRAVDENGEPMVMYHGSPTSGFLRFDTGKIGDRSDTAGIHFTDSRHVAASYSGTRDEYIPPTKWQDAGLTIEKDDRYNEWGVYSPDGDNLAYGLTRRKAEKEAQALIDNGEYEPENPGIYAGFINLRNSQKTEQYSQDIDLHGGAWSDAIYWSEKDQKYRTHGEYDGRVTREDGDDGDIYYDAEGKELGQFVAFNINDLIKQAKDMDDMGIIVRNVHDDGGEMGSQYSAGDSTQAIIFDATNFKSIHNNGKFNPDDSNILLSGVPGEVDLWGNATSLHALQPSMFESHPTPKSEARDAKERIAELKKPLDNATVDYLAGLEQGDDKQIAKTATQILDTVTARLRFQTGYDLNKETNGLIDDAADAIDAFQMARKLDTPIEQMLPQQDFSGKTLMERLSPQALDFARAMEAGTFEKAFKTAMMRNSGDDILQMVAWHGSPHTFDKFDSSKIGTGEGAQAYGHGIYFTDKESIADYYKEKLGEQNLYVGGKKMPWTFDTKLQFNLIADAEASGATTPAEVLEFVKGELERDNIGPRDFAEFKRISKAGYKIVLEGGAKYRVDLKPAPDEYLLWDKPLSEQSEKVKAALAEDYEVEPKEDFADLTGKEIYEHEAGKISQNAANNEREAVAIGQREASDYLKSLGIRGIKYLDGSSRGKGEGSYNYVIFDDSDVEIQDVQFNKPFYSGLERTIEDKMPKRANADQVWGILKDTKQEERDWLGIDQYLDENPVVKKDDLLAFVRENNVDVQEVVKGAAVPIDDTPLRDKGYILDYRTDPFGVVGLPIIRKGHDFYYSDDNYVGMPEADRGLAIELRDLKHDRSGDTKFGSYTLPGGPLSRDTEILTNEGWKRIDSVNVGEEILTRQDNTGILEWQPIEALPTVFADKLYHFKNQSIDMMVTPFHQMVVKKRRRNQDLSEHRTTAEQLWNQSEMLVPLTGEWLGGVDGQLFNRDAGDIAEFIGWYLAEGSYKHRNGHKNTIQISQSKSYNPEKCERLEALFDRLGFGWKYYTDSYGVGARKMPKGLVALLHSQPASGEKYIPKFFFNASRRVIGRLISGLVRGDGCITPATEIRKAKIVLTSKSARMTDDFQALVLLIGFRAAVRQRKTGLWVATVNTKRFAGIDDAKHAIIDYNDTAFCVTVKNHAIYVRRNGVAAFTGNSNYKELLLTLPGKHVEPQLKPGLRIIQGADGDRLWNIEQKNGIRVFIRGYPTREALEETISGDTSLVTTAGAEFKSNHFSDTPGYIAHARFDDRDSGETLHLAEIQSDLAKKIRSLEQAVKDGKASDADKAELERLKPLMSHPKSWNMLVFKRVLRLAVERGYKRITWDVGATQADRYDLRQEVDGIHWKGTPDGGKEVSVDYKKDGLVVEFTLDKDDRIQGSKIDAMEGKKLDEAVGKEIARRIVDEPAGSVTGEGLKVGGEGMAAFYDKIQVNDVNKYVKPWGGKVEDAMLWARPDVSKLLNDWSKTLFEKAYADLDADEKHDVDFEAMGEYNAAADGRGSTAPVHSLEITPAMRESVMAGQTLFDLTPVESRKAGRMFRRTATLTTDELIQQAKFGLSDQGVFEAKNMPALRIVQEAVKSLDDRYGGQFSGAYFMPTAAPRLREALDNLRKHFVANGEKENAKAIGKAVAIVDMATDPAHGDLTFAVNIPQLPELSKTTTQEELAHRNNSRSGARAIFADIDITPVLKEEMDNLGEGYARIGLTNALDEVFAKSIRDDAPVKNQLAIWNTLINALDKAGIDVNNYADEAAKISRAGRRFAQNATNKSNQRALEANPGGETQTRSAPGDQTSIRDTGPRSGADTQALDRNDDGAGFRQAGLSRPDQGTDQGLTQTGNKMPQTESPEFQNWFKNSKVVDENGEPLRVYRGDVEDKEGIFFTSSTDTAEGYTRSTFFRGGNAPQTTAAYLSLQNPLIIDALGKRNDNIPVPWSEWKPKVFGNLPDTAVSVEGAYAYALKKGHDGLIVRNVVDTADPTERAKPSDVYAVKSPSQVKSAIGNRGTFDPNEDNILFAKNTLTRKALNQLDKVFEKSASLSSTRAMEDAVSKNLQQLREADEDAYEQVLKFAGTTAQVTADAMANGGTSPDFAQELYNQNLTDVLTTLQIAGLAEPVRAGEPTPTEVAGKTAGILHIGDRAFAMPIWLSHELRPVVDKQPEPHAVQRIMRKLNAFGAAGLLDAVFHSANVIGTLIGTTPYVGTDILSRTVGNTPVTKWLTTLLQLAVANPEKTDPQIIRDMAEAGVIPNKWGRITYSKRLAEILGANQKKLSLMPAMMGPKGLDIRSRIIMWKIGRHINPNASNADMADFVNQLGIYSRALESHISRSLKRSDIAPFFTAGSQMMKNGALMWLGKTPMPNEGASAASRAAVRIQQQLSAGVLGLIAVWIAMSLLYRKKYPWQDDKSRFLQIPLNAEDRSTPLAQKVWGADTNSTAYVGMGFLSPLAERGARTLGISGAYDEKMLGGNGQQMFEAGMKDAINSAMHPVTSSPIVRAGVIGLTGKEPDIAGFRSYGGKFGAELYGADLPKNAGLGRSLFEGGLQLNPFLGGILHNFGVNRDKANIGIEQQLIDPNDPEAGTENVPTVGEANLYFKTILDMTFPRLFKNDQDRSKKVRSVAAEKRAIDRLNFKR